MKWKWKLDVISCSDMNVWFEAGIDLLVLEMVDWKGKCFGINRRQMALVCTSPLTNVTFIQQIQWQGPYHSSETLQSSVLPAPFLSSILQLQMVMVPHSTCISLSWTIWNSNTRIRMQKYERFFISVFIFYGTTSIYCLYLLSFLSTDLCCVHGLTKR